ncbi:lipid-A-disaccharide synthase [Azomonas agilis]|uniref:Lipid-A-disaccharide synthase n=1 Tax=Azomonas agilis TaxID=116849 RepID=A0A562I123_9GAMM|nr:lipid-A-disaccharide synthase [Azomonas agilis]TWH64710.1 lipid-A-disaccharide synthase [Azomonas agilis]
MALPADIKPLTIALVAGEASGDILGAGLMQALKARTPHIRFIGVGGSRMQAEGLDSFFPQERLAVMGLVEVLGRLPELLWRRYALVRYLIQQQPDVFIGIDAPDFNLGLELKLRHAGIRTVHYVSPSVWAWRQKRVLKIRKACDLMLTLLPFEARFYEEHQVPVHFIGHPLADQIEMSVDSGAARKRLGLSAEDSVIALMPGSRGGEVSRLGSLFLETARLLQIQRPNIRFILPCATPERRHQLEQLLLDYPELSVRLLDGQSHEALTACNAVLIASGTATLEALLHRRPMVVAYRVSNMTYRIAKRLVKTPFFALPNLLAGRLLVPEFIQDAAQPNAMVPALIQALDHPQEQVATFAKLHQKLRLNASHQAAEAVLELVAQ